METPKRKTTTTLVSGLVGSDKLVFCGTLVGVAGSVEGRRIMLGIDEVWIGRDEVCEIRLTDMGISRKHVAIRQSTLGLLLEDNDSTNGTYVNEEKVHKRVLVDGDTIRIGDAVLRFVRPRKSDDRVMSALHRKATRDELTGCSTYIVYRAALETELARAIEYSRDLVTIVLDVDGLGAINQEHGEQGGDAVLQHVVRRFQQFVKPGDILAREVGGRFALLLPERSSLMAERLGNELRSLVAAKPFSIGEGVTADATLSLGLVGMEELRDVLPERLRRVPTDEIANLFLGIADAKLFDAKNQGRNRLVS